MEVVKQIQDLIKQIDPAQAVVVAGVLSSAVHGLLKRYKNLSKATNVVVSFVLPLVGAVLATLVANGSVLAHYGQAYVIAQASYQVVQAIQRSALTKQVQAETQQF